MRIYGFNRYMVECEFLSFEALDRFYSVLIDTWWNVNIHNYDSNIRRTNVLIDTWWNVNLLNLRTLPEADIRFNRYMVECEWRNFEFRCSWILVLIDTWWNVNLSSVCLSLKTVVF